MTTTDLRAAAERVLGAIEQTRCDSYTEHRLRPGCRVGLQDSYALAQHVRDTVRDDDRERVTGSWCKELGLPPCGVSRHGHAVYELCYKPVAVFVNSGGQIAIGSGEWRDNQTRSDVRALAKALGVELKEQGERDDA